MNVVPLELGIEDEDGDVADGAKISKFLDLKGHFELNQVPEHILHDANCIDQEGGNKKGKHIVLRRIIRRGSQVWIIGREIPPA